MGLGTGKSHRWAWPYFVGAISILATPACAGSAVAVRAILDNCQNRDLPPDVRIDACTKLLYSNLLSPKMQAVIHVIRAGDYEAKPDNELAMQDYNEAIRLMPEFPEAFANRGAMFERLGKVPEAADDFEKAGLIRLKHGDCAKALPEFEEAVSDDPHRSIALYARGVCQKHLGNAAAAEADMKAATVLDPEAAKHFEALQ